jgi:hypothetical protein
MAPLSQSTSRALPGILPLGGRVCVTAALKDPSTQEFSDVGVLMISDSVVVLDIKIIYQPFYLTEFPSGVGLLGVYLP